MNVINKRKALVTGVTGQDGSYLAELLLAKGYEVHGTKRRSSSFNTGRVDHLMRNPNFHLHYMDVCGPVSIDRVMQIAQPDEIYNLAGQSHVGLSFELPFETAQSTGIGTLNVLESYRVHCPKARFYQASSSEMFGNQPAPQSETTPLAPVSPYGAAKVFAHNTAVTYRTAYGLPISCGILFNHESPRRGETFVTRKITMGLARIKAGLQDHIVLGNLDARRDWGYAPEYVQAMWMMLQRDEPGDFIVGTGISRSVGDFLRCCLALANLPVSVVEIDERYKRPVEVNHLVADRRKAEDVLGWTATKCAPDIAELMMQADMKETFR